MHSRLSTFVVHHNRQHHHLGQLQLLQVHTAPRQQHNQQQQFVQHRMATKAAAAGGAADANLPPAEAAVAPSTSADDVRGALRELLPTVDMDSTTERKVHTPPKVSRGGQHARVYGASAVVALFASQAPRQSPEEPFLLCYQFASILEAPQTLQQLSP